MSKTSTKDNVCLNLEDLDQNQEKDEGKISETNSLIVAKKVQKNSYPEQIRADDKTLVSSR